MQLNDIFEYYPEDEFIVMDGLDSAIVGVVEDDIMKLAYSKRKIIEHFMDEGMSYEEAMEYADFNVFCAYVGKGTPVLIEDRF